MVDLFEGDCHFYSWARRPRFEQRCEAGIGAYPQGDIRMLDLILIAVGLGFFALSIAYVLACDRL